VDLKLRGDRQALDLRANKKMAHISHVVMCVHVNNIGRRWGGTSGTIYLKSVPKL